jgi:hypothetical protein
VREDESHDRRFLMVNVPISRFVEEIVSADLEGIHFRRLALSHLSERLPWDTPTR